MSNLVVICCRVCGKAITTHKVDESAARIAAAYIHLEAHEQTHSPGLIARNPRATRPIQEDYD